MQHLWHNKKNSNCQNNKHNSLPLAAKGVVFDNLNIIFSKFSVTYSVYSLAIQKNVQARTERWVSTMHSIVQILMCKRCDSGAVFRWEYWVAWNGSYKYSPCYIYN